MTYDEYCDRVLPSADSAASFAQAAKVRIAQDQPGQARACLVIAADLLKQALERFDTLTGVQP